MGRPRPRTKGKKLGTIPYVLEDNRNDPPDEQTKFHIHGLSGGRRKAVRTMLYGAGEQTRDNDTGKTKLIVNVAENYDAAELAVVHGLVDWENFCEPDDATGEEKEVKWPGTGREAVDEHLHEDVVQELALRIWEMSELTKEEAGN